MGASFSVPVFPEHDTIGCEGHGCPQQPGHGSKQAPGRQTPCRSAGAHWPAASHSPNRRTPLPIRRQSRRWGQRVAATFSPVASEGSAAGTRIRKSVARSPAAQPRARSSHSRRVDESPSWKADATGKKVISAAMKTLEGMPKPNQMTTSGAMAKTGSVCVVTIAGRMSRLANCQWAMASASTAPERLPAARPSSISASVVAACPAR